MIKKLEEVVTLTTTTTSLRVIAAKPEISPATAPYTSYPQQQDEGELHFLHDKLYSLHGKIMAFIVILIFSLFILFLVLIPCLSRATGMPWKFRLLMRREQRTTLPVPETPLQLKDEFS